jgi:hypothetical protein
MIRIETLLFGILLLSSCEIKNKVEDHQEIRNQLIITSEGDSLENGFWTYDKGISGVSQSGSYEDGYKIGKWIYKTSTDSISVSWSIINDKNVKFNMPDLFKPLRGTEAPILFQADVEDNDNYTYFVILRYNLLEVNSSIYGYLYQYNESLKSNSQEILVAKEFKKFYFKGIEVFRAKVETRREINYEAISYIFVVKDVLYDLTYKNTTDKISAIDLEIFNDILYSIDCDNTDLFDYNNRKYWKEENVEFKDDPS